MRNKIQKVVDSMKKNATKFGHWLYKEHSITNMFVLQLGLVIIAISLEFIR